MCPVCKSEYTDQIDAEACEKRGRPPVTYKKGDRVELRQRYGLGRLYNGVGVVKTTKSEVIRDDGPPVRHIRCYTIILESPQDMQGNVIGVDESFIIGKV